MTTFFTALLAFLTSISVLTVTPTTRTALVAIPSATSAPIQRHVASKPTAPLQAITPLNWPCGHYVLNIPNPNVYHSGANGYVYPYVTAPQMLTVMKGSNAVSDPVLGYSLRPVDAGTVLPAGGYADLASGRWWWVALPVMDGCDGFMWISAG